MSAGMILIPILVPLITGACLPRLHFKERKHWQAYIAVSVIVTSLSILALILKRPEGTLTLIPMTENFAIAFRMDGLSCVFCGLIGFLWPLASFYAFEYMEHEENQERFFSFYTMTYGITVGIATSANLITMYLCYELLTLATMPLVSHEMDNRAVSAGRKYLIYSIGGASMAFIGIMILFMYGNPSVSFTFGGFVDPAGGNRTILLIGYLFTFFGFGVKAAVFPLHGWLPTAGVAPTPVTALLHAVAVVKAGVFAIIRSTYYCFGPAFLQGSWAQYVTMTFALITILYGSSMALRDQHIKRRLAYSTVSNLSYILFGVTMLTTDGLIGALSHMLFHGLMKITLFFCAGAIICKTGREYVSQLDGYGSKMKITMATFTIASLALTGVPLLPGFISKWNLAKAAVGTGVPLAYAGVGVLMISAVLTAAYLFMIVIRAYFPKKEFDPLTIEDVHDPGPCMTVPFIILCIAMLILGMHSAPLMDALTQVAAGAI